MEQIVRQLDTLLERNRSAWQQLQHLDDEIPPSLVRGLLTSAEAMIERLAPPDSPYVRNATSILESSSHDPYKLEMIIGIIEALREDYAAGTLVPVTQLIRAEIFDDFLEMSEHLLNQGYKDPAAVITGSVLEDHLRTLCVVHGIPVTVGDHPKKADQMNSELTAASAYNKLDQKSITAWLGLRNSAAHGLFQEYEQIR